MNWKPIIFVFFTFLLHAHSIVFVHIGPDLPSYLHVAMEQARLFNRDCPIYLIANKRAIERNSQVLRVDDKITCVSCESLPQSSSHQRFCKESTLDKRSFQGFWTFTSERFFYLEELIREKGLKDVFHLENDVMLYRDLEEFLPIFQKGYSGKIAATFDNEKRCIPGFLYIAEPKAMTKLAHFMADRAKKAQNDMEMLSDFRVRGKSAFIEMLPIVIPEYFRDFGLQNQLGEKAKKPAAFSQNFASFQSIFDAAAIGQYLGGVSPRNGKAVPGFINESCFFDPSRFTYSWKEDKENRRVPFLRYKGVEYPINNLHIHSKDLHRFSSRRSH